MVYECKRECGYKRGSRLCLSYQLRKLAEEVAEAQQAMFEDEQRLFDNENQNLIREWKDVKTMIEGIEQEHPWMLKL